MSNGNVGVGTTNPEYKLDILGTIRAKEIIVNDLGEMQNKLLQKIEELTLYVIEQQKQIEVFKKIVAKDKLVSK